MKLLITKKQKAKCQEHQEELLKELERLKREEAYLIGRHWCVEKIKEASEKIKEDGSRLLYPYANQTAYTDTLFVKGRHYVSKRTKICLSRLSLYAHSYNWSWMMQQNLLREYDNEVVKPSYPRKQLEDYLNQKLTEVEDNDNPMYMWNDEFVLYCTAVKAEADGLVYSFSDPFASIQTLPTKKIPLAIASRMPREYVHVTLRYHMAKHEFELWKVKEIIETDYKKLSENLIPAPDVEPIVVTRKKPCVCPECNGKNIYLKTTIDNSDSESKISEMIASGEWICRECGCLLGRKLTVTDNAVSARSIKIEAAN